MSRASAAAASVLASPSCNAWANLLGHRIGVRSRPGKGSGFAIEVTLPQDERRPLPEHHATSIDDRTKHDVLRKGAILIVEDDPDVCDLLELVLKEEGHWTATAADGVAALKLVERGAIQPDIVVADYNLPNGLNGLELTAKLREILRRDCPVIILTGDISTGALQRYRPSGLQAPQQAGQGERADADYSTASRIIGSRVLLRMFSSRSKRQVPAPSRRSLSLTMKAMCAMRFAACWSMNGWNVESYSSCEKFLEADRADGNGCLLIDAYLPGMSGLELLRRLGDSDHRMPAIMITGKSDVPMAVQAMKAGASDFIEKPIGRAELIASIERALEQSRDATKLSAWRDKAADQIASLTSRQRADHGYWCSPDTPARILLQISASANGLLKIIAPRSCERLAPSLFRPSPVWRWPQGGIGPMS